MKQKTGILLVNLGTPDSPAVPDVRKYLRQFLMDGRVIDIHPFKRFMLVNFIIAPFRAPKSAKVYKELWTEKGSPLMYHGVELAGLLQAELGSEYIVSLGMRYQNPSIESALKVLKDRELKKIIVVPLFPQYASATTGSVHEEVMRIVSRWQVIPKLVMIDSYADHEGMIRTFAEIGHKHITSGNFDHFIFTYHGLPERQITKADHTGQCLVNKNCCETFTAANRLCYRAQCFETSRRLAAELGIKREDYTVSFQSRLGKTPWIRPYTDETIEALVEQGKKRILAFSPSFVADCLETTIEVGEEYKELFEEKGGEHWQLVESLNTHPMWVEALKDIIMENE